jgi:hypothetical protein
MSGVIKAVGKVFDAVVIKPVKAVFNGVKDVAMTIWHTPILRYAAIAVAAYFTAGAAMAYFAAPAAAGGTAAGFAAGASSASVLSGTAMYTGAAAGAAATAGTAVGSYAALGATTASLAASANVASVVAATSVGASATGATVSAAASMAAEASTAGSGAVTGTSAGLSGTASSTASGTAFSDASMYGPIMPAAGGASTADAAALPGTLTTATAAPALGAGASPILAAAANVAGYTNAANSGSGGSSAADYLAASNASPASSATADTSAPQAGDQGNGNVLPSAPKSIFQSTEDWFKGKLGIGTPSAPAVGSAAGPVVPSGMSSFEKIMLMKSAVDMASGYLRPTSQQQFSGATPNGGGFHLGMHTTNGGFSLSPGGSEPAPSGVPGALLPNQPAPSVGSAGQYSALGGAPLAGYAQPGNLGQAAANSAGIGGLVTQGAVNYMGSQA